jgi:hypothetical protein
MRHKSCAKGIDGAWVPKQEDGMNISSSGRVVLIFAALAFAGQMSMAAEDAKNKAMKPGAAQPGQGIQSTKASGAEKVAQSHACAGVAPKIKTVVPDEGKTGDKITITGENFGDAGCVTGVSFGPGSPAKFTHVNSGRVTAVVPEGKRGIKLLTLTNSTGEDSKPFLRK